MPRPTSKTDLLLAIEKEWGALQAVLDPLSPGAMTEPGIVGEWSVKDMLAHLLTWQRMVLRWYREGEQGLTPQLPAPGYKWNQIPQLNQQIYEHHRDRPLDDVVVHFHTSHGEMLALIEALSDEVLFTRGHLPWANNNTLGSYITSATSSHYSWAKQEIRKGLRLQQHQTSM